MIFELLSTSRGQVLCNVRAQQMNAKRSLFVETVTDHEASVWFGSCQSLSVKLTETNGELGAKLLTGEEDRSRLAPPHSQLGNAAGNKWCVS